MTWKRETNEEATLRHEKQQSMSWQQIRDENINKLKDITKAVTSGFIEKEIQAERYAICESCYYFKKLTRQCNVCSCFMPVKTLFNKSRCPKGYWNK
tara:strand:+ start:1153 stop:1443 length:291 start_codon:yes stop_codon:yes gene_type:complete